ncbi:nucleoside-diphosphate sugar epimerase/dehydratase [Alteromonas sp. W364]|uniref:polysaccharide biosynthesis protein n=1 Tax=Alteromonas sp. W364 TaxID=3075610 RepID=UPI002884110C|nr:nucleoside-diphosphate sugar epimerase/dehydratase [Alteromonas sp. W364]MDT0627745.1 nucleoside-diphosphate sugar epimerase/dehydratase [Alteromonas sp. W364]
MENKLITNSLNRIFNSKRSVKRIITLTVDSIFIVLSFWAALVIRLDNLSAFSNFNYWLILSGLLPLSIIIFIKLGLYRAVLRYMSSQAVWAVVAGTMLSTAALVLIAFFSTTTVPRTMPLIYCALILLTVGGARLLVRALVTQFTGSDKRPVVIYGAGSAGRQLATGIATGPEFYVSAFIDDDENKHGSVIQGIPVTSLSGLKDLMMAGKAIKVLLALPSASRSTRNRIINSLEKYQIQVQTIPGIADVIEGKVNPSELIDVEIEDLLGREPVTPLPQLMAQNITAKNVMVSGAGGSIGSELCRQIIKFKPAKLVLFELSEFALYQIEKELSEYIKKNGLNIKLYPLMGSVQRINRVENVMKAFSVDTVYHAAAYKHVPLVEHNVVEGIRNNVFGTYFAAKAAINAGVETFVLVSTDKAVRPTNVMGASKRMAELVLQALAQAEWNSTTRFCMVRFGNVLGSSGSVVPLFRRQIQEGGPITLTHEDITRYFMTIPEAAQLVIQAGAMGKGGDVFVLDMGESVKIKDLAEKLVRLSGLEVKDEDNPNGDIAIQCTGLRPGEKLYEELLIGDNVQETFHERIMTANEAMLSWEDLEPLLDELDTVCHNFDHEKIRQILLDAPTGFNPTDGICDLVWEARNQSTESKPEVAQIISLPKK